MSLMLLPTEIHLELLSTLNYESLINLTSTNHYFRSLRTDQLIKSALLHLEHVCLEKERGGPIYHTRDELERMDRVHGFLPCYSCLKLRKRVSAFCVCQRRGPFGLVASKAGKRCCTACGLYHSREHSMVGFRVIVPLNIGRT